MRRLRIPYQVAAQRLATRLKASPGEVALWVAGFVTGTSLTAFESELDDAPPLDFQAGIYVNDPDWLDYGKKLAGCYFDERAIDTINPKRRFISVMDAVRRLRDIVNDMPDAEGFIKSRIMNDGLECLHPIAGVPDLDDQAQFLGSLLPRSEFEAALKRYFPDVGNLTPVDTTRGHDFAKESQVGNARVAWRQVLNSHIAEIDKANNGRASVSRVIHWLKKNGGSRILPKGQPDELFWVDDQRTCKRVSKATVSNALTYARRVSKSHG